MRNFCAPIALSAFALFQCECAHADTLFGGLGAPAWSRMFKYIESRYGSVAKDDLVMIPPVAPVSDWDVPNKTLRLAHMVSWGDEIPSRAYQYIPNPNKRVSDGYKFFLDSAYTALLAKDGTQSTETKIAIANASSALDAARNLYFAKQKEFDKAFKDYVISGGTLSKAAFLKKFKYNEQLDQYQKQIYRAMNEFKKASDLIVDPNFKKITDAKLKLANPKQQIYLPLNEETLNDPTRWEKRYITLLEDKMPSFMTERVPTTQHIEEAFSQSDYFEQRWKASLSVKFLGLFRSGGADAEQVTKEKHIQDNTTKIYVKYSNISTFKVMRGEWFDQSIIDLMAPKLSPGRYDEIFGVNGQLELIPKSLLVARGLVFSVYADSSTLDTLDQQFRASADAGFFINYFSVGVNGEFSTNKNQVKETRFSDHIEFADLSGRGKVLAVLCKNYSASIARPAALTVAALSSQATVSDAELEQIFGPQSEALQSFVSDMEPEDVDAIRSGE